MNHEALLEKKLNELVDNVLATLKSAEYATRYQQMLIRPDIYKYIYGFKCYLEAVFEISDYIDYSTYREFKDTVDIVEEEAEECFGYPVIYYFN